MSDENKAPKRKLPREVELRQEIRALDAAYRDSFEKVQTEAGVKLNAKLKASLAETAQHNKSRDVQHSLLREARDKGKRAAEAVYQSALRKAQSERDRAIKHADASFEQDRDALEVETGKLTLPVRQAYDEAAKQLITEAHAALKELSDKYKSEREPRVTELKDVEQKLAEATAAAEERKKVREAAAAETKTEETPAAP